MDEKMRVYELAKELNISNKALRDLLTKLGIAAKSHLSPLKVNEIAIVKHYKATLAEDFYFDIKLKQGVVKRIPVEERITTLTESIRYNPIDSQLYYRRGMLYSYLGKTIDALNDYNRSIKLDSQYVKAYYARAELYVAINNKQLAMKDLEKALELDLSKSDRDSSSNSPKEKKANKLLHSLKELEHYLLRLATAYIESDNDLLPFLDLIGVDKSDYDLDYLFIEPKDLVSVILGSIDAKSCSNQLIDFINMSNEQNEFDLWRLFYRFIER
jgi:tetratricopeptide (TPR) repeat protein